MGNQKLRRLLMNVQAGPIEMAERMVELRTEIAKSMKMHGGQAQWNGTCSGNSTCDGNNECKNNTDCCNNGCCNNGCAA
jgi:hypothetical protein